MKRLLLPMLIVVFAGQMTIASARQEDSMKMGSHETIESRGGHTLSSVGGPLDQSLQGKPVVVRIHADWCPACKETASTLDAVRKQYNDKITYLQFDVTNAKTAAAAQEKAQKLGLGTFFEATKAATSTVAIIDPKSGAVETELYDDSNMADYTAAIDKALDAMHGAMHDAMHGQ